ncbi:MAG: universal stress protein [Gemmatimonadaceae bacterium]
MRLTRIIVGTDFGKASLAAARWVRRDVAPAAELLLVHVAPTAIAAASSALARRLFEAAAELAPLGTGPVRTEARSGDAAVALAEAAAQWSADLVVVGEHEQGMRAPDAFGGTALRLVACARTPVLAAAGVMAGPPLKLLVPVEGGDIGAPTFEWARDLEERFDARLAIVLVAGGSRAGAVDAPPRWRQLAATREADRLFVDAVAGDPPAAIAAEALRFHSDLVLMDADDAAAVSGVLRRAACPVLIAIDPAAPMPPIADPRALDRMRADDWSHAS